MIKKHISIIIILLAIIVSAFSLGLYMNQESQIIHIAQLDIEKGLYQQAYASLDKLDSPQAKQLQEDILEDWMDEIIKFGNYNDALYFTKNVELTNEQILLLSNKINVRLIKLDNLDVINDLKRNQYHAKTLYTLLDGYDFPNKKASLFKDLCYRMSIQEFGKTNDQMYIIENRYLFESLFNYKFINKYLMTDKNIASFLYGNWYSNNDEYLKIDLKDNQLMLSFKLSNQLDNHQEFFFNSNILFVVNDGQITPQFQLNFNDANQITIYDYHNLAYYKLNRE